MTSSTSSHSPLPCPSTPFASLVMPLPIPVHPKCSKSTRICTHTLALESTVVLIHQSTSPFDVHNLCLTNFILPVLVSRVPCPSPRPNTRRGTSERTSSSLPQDRCTVDGFPSNARVLFFRLGRSRNSTTRIPRAPRPATTGVHNSKFRTGNRPDLALSIIPWFSEQTNHPRSSRHRSQIAT